MEPHTSLQAIHPLIRFIPGLILPMIIIAGCWLIRQRKVKLASVIKPRERCLDVAPLFGLKPNRRIRITIPN